MAVSVLARYANGSMALSLQVLDQRGNGSPILHAHVMPGEKSILSIKCYRQKKLAVQ